MADTLLRAIKEKFESTSSLVTSCPGGLWTSEIPEDTQIPYVALEHEGTAFEFTMSGGTKWIEQSGVCFNVYAAGAEAVEDIMEELLDTFRLPGCLSFQQKQLMAMRPSATQIMSTPGRYEDGRLIYVGSVHFDVKVSKFLGP